MPLEVRQEGEILIVTIDPPDRRNAVDGVTAREPWADHRACFTRPFEEQIAWPAVE